MLIILMVLPPSPLVMGVLRLAKYDSVAFLLEKKLIIESAALGITFLRCIALYMENVLK